MSNLRELIAKTEALRPMHTSCDKDVHGIDGPYIPFKKVLALLKAALSSTPPSGGRGILPIHLPTTEAAASVRLDGDTQVCKSTGRVRETFESKVIRTCDVIGHDFVSPIDVRLNQAFLDADKFRPGDLVAVTVTLLKRGGK